MPDLRDELASYYEDRFGVDPGYWEQYQCHETGDSIWIASRGMQVREAKQAAGIRALRRTNLGLKPTTYMLQVLDDELRTNVVRLDEEELRRLVIDRETLTTDLPWGYVALCFEDAVIGCGLVTDDGLRTQIPKGRTQALEAVLDRDDSSLP